MARHLRAQRMQPIALAVILLAASGMQPSQGQEAVMLATDITFELSGTTFEDQEVATGNQLGLVNSVPLGALPEASDVSAFHLLPRPKPLKSLRLLSFDTWVELTGSSGSLTAAPGDVVGFDGDDYSIEFDASGASGIPDGVIVDAVSVHDSGDLMLSFDTTVDLGGGVTAQDEDLVRFTGSDYTLFFDGSAVLPADLAVPEGLDLDGADYRVSDGRLLLSFDGSGSFGTGIGRVDFDDEDILEFDSSGPTWSLYYDGDAVHPTLAAADVIAVPEPRIWLQLAVGMGLLVALYRTRRRRLLDAHPLVSLI